MLTQFLAKVSRVDSHDYHVGWGDGAGDQLNSVHTVYMLLAFSGFSLSGFFFVEPIECWCPAFFTKSHVKFTNKVRSGGKKETCSKLRQEICSKLESRDGKYYEESTVLSTYFWAIASINTKFMHWCVAQV